MCGFINYFGECEKRAGQIATALDLVAHRGPDSSGIKKLDVGTLGFVRLSIIDLSAESDQPMHFETEDGQEFHLTFNGEIYNYQDLAVKHLGGKTDRGDTFVLGKLICKLGLMETLPLLRGMFAISWYDVAAQKVSFARDRFGMKPLYYSIDDKQLIFGSELRAVSKVLGHDFQISTNAAAEFLKWGAVQQTDTILKGVSGVESGACYHWSLVDRNLECQLFASAIQDETLKKQTQSFGEAVEIAKQSVTESVNYHMRSDVPVGVFLSGGLDSSIIAALMSQRSTERVKAFSVRFLDNDGYPDETVVAQKTADYLNIDFSAIEVSSSLLLSWFDEFCTALDQPSIDAFNTFIVSKEASKHVKVVLSGVGADEFFAGYTSHRYIKLSEVGGSAMLLGAPSLFRPFTRLLPKEGKYRKSARAAKFLTGVYGRTSKELYQEFRGFFSNQELEEMCLALPRDIFDLPTLPGGHDTLSEYLMTERLCYLKNMILRDCDAVSMWHSLELRVPFVDSEVALASGKISKEFMLNWSQGKWCLRDAFRDILPPWIYEVRTKNTFSIPFVRWLKRDEWKAKVNDIFNRAKESGLAEIIDFRVVEKLAKEFYDEQGVMLRGDRRSERLWAVIVLCNWYLLRQ